MEKLCYNDLKKKMGETDSVNEYIELIVRKFESEKHGIAELSAFTSIYGIKVNEFDVSEALLMIRKNYIVSVNLVFENFLYRISENLKLAKNYKSKDDKESLLRNIYRNTFGLKNVNSNEYLYYLLCDYYRLVRNCSVHRDKDKGDTISKAYDEVLLRKKKIKTLFPKLNVLGNCGNVEFDDFILFSNVSKKLALAIEKNIDYDSDKIIEGIDLTRFKKYKNSNERLSKSLKIEIKGKYYLNEKQLDSIVETLIRKI